MKALAFVAGNNINFINQKQWQRRTKCL